MIIATIVVLIVWYFITTKLIWYRESCYKNIKTEPKFTYFLSNSSFSFCLACKQDLTVEFWSHFWRNSCSICLRWLISPRTFLSSTSSRPHDSQCSICCDNGDGFRTAFELLWLSLLICVACCCDSFCLPRFRRPRLRSVVSVLTVCALVFSTTPFTWISCSVFPFCLHTGFSISIDGWTLE